MRRLTVLLMWTTVVLAGCGPTDTARTAQAGKTAAAGGDMGGRAERGARRSDTGLDAPG
jgi:uncharacterized protein YceK